MTTHEAQRVKASVDRRLLITYGVLVGVLILAVSYITYDQNRYEKDRATFEHAVIVNCETNRKNTLALNSFIDSVISAVQANKELTPAEKDARVQAYQDVRQVVPACPPDDGISSMKGTR